MLDYCSLKRSLDSIEVTVACLVTLTHLETTLYMLDPGEARRDRITNVSSQPQPHTVRVHPTNQLANPILLPISAFNSTCSIRWSLFAVG